MPQAPMPAAVEVFYKLRTQKMQELRLGTTLSQPDVDSDSVLAGTQNQADFSVDFDPANEKYDLFYRSVNEGKTGKVITIIRTGVQSTLSGAINATTTAFTIVAPSNTDSFQVGSIIEIEDELMILSSWNTGTGAAVVEERGAHGTEAVSHADTTVVFRMGYTVPHNFIVLTGNLDASLPLAPTTLVVNDVVGAVGNGMAIEIGLPVSQIKSLFRVHIQVSTVLWPEDFENTTGTIGTQATGADGAIVQGGTALTTSVTLNTAWAGKLIHTYESINVATGEVSAPDILRISTVVDNGDGTWTVNISGDNVYNLRRGALGVAGVVSWTIVDDFRKPGNPSTNVENIKPFFNQGASRGDPDVLAVQHIVWTAEAAYVRARLRNFEGYGPWMYHNGAGGTTTRLSATTFTTNGVGSGGIEPDAVGPTEIADNAVTAAKLTENSMNYNSNLIFSATDNNTVSWGSGTIEFADGSTFAIDAGNTGNMTALTFIYLDPVVSVTVLQLTTVYNTAVGDRKQIITWAKDTALVGERAFFNHLFGNAILNSEFLGPNSVTNTVIADNSISTPKLQANSVDTAQLTAGAVTAAKIEAGTITATQIQANTITGNQISGTTLSAIFADIGTIVSGTSITGVLIGTSVSGHRVQMNATSDDLEFFGASGGAKARLDYEAGGDLFNISSVVDVRITVLSGKTLTLFGGGLGNIVVSGAAVDIFANLDMNTDNIQNVGNLELDSLTKDGAGDILLNDTFNMNSNNLDNVGFIRPPTDNSGQCGTAGRTWNLGAFTDIHLFDTTYRFPTGSGSSGQQLQTNGSGTLSWAAAGSRREWKNILDFTISPNEALKKLCETPVYPFKYKPGHGTQDTDTTYVGVMADNIPEVMHHGNSIFSPVSGFGYSVLAIQALETRIRELEDRLNA